MKKVVFCSLAAIGMLSFASCSSQEDGPVAGGDGVYFTIELPGHMNSRGTFGDGTGAGDRAILNNLQWTVFEVGADGTTLTKVFSDEKTGAFAGSQTQETVMIPLAKGKTYQVGFYADDATNSFCTYADGDITVDYANGASNTAAEDAFIGKSAVFTVTGAYNETVTLTRPYAQLNWGTNDLDAKVLQNIIPSLTAQVSVKSGLFTKMNVIGGGVSDPVTDISFAAVELAADKRPGQTFPVEGTPAYALIAMNYLLTGEGTVDCELAFNNGLTAVTVNAAPVKVNYRTNIYGQLLTAPGNFNILVDNNFVDPDNNIGLTPSEPETDADGTYLVKTQGELEWIAQQANASATPYTKNISLQNDIFMVGAWTPIGIGTNFNNRYCGTFDGNGHTIHNMNVTTNDRSGFFGFMNGVVKNLNFEGAVVKSNHWAGVVAGYSDNETGTARIENCKVNNSTVTIATEQIDGNWDNGDKAGGIIGYMAANDQVTGCTVSNTTIQAYRDLGGIIGYSNGSVISGNTVDNVTLIVDNTNNYKSYTTLADHDVNAVIGENHGTDTDNTFGTVNIGTLAATQADFAAAVAGLDADGTLTVYLGEGSFTVPSVNKAGATLNVVGTTGTVVNTSTNGNAVKILNLSNLTVQGGQNYKGFQHVGESTTFTNCTIDGVIFGYSPELVFTDCVFNTNNYAVWTYAATKADFTDCTFNNSLQAKAILVYSENASYTGIDVTVENCTFTAPSSSSSDKGVVEIHTETFDGTQTGVIKINASTYTGPFQGWVREIKNDDETVTNYWTVEITDCNPAQ